MMIVTNCIHVMDLKMAESALDDRNCRLVQSNGQNSLQILILENPTGLQNHPLPNIFFLRTDL